ncbi:MAG: hypothetical protein NT139_01560 [Candidatus Woesearchaeota archaeon]|nr:hypothetical protein [Candidatus Woesearchaeota archaeon]
MSLENRILKFTLPYITALSILTGSALAQNPDSMYHFMLGNLYKNEGNLECATKNYYEAFNHDEKSSYLNNIIAETLIQQGKFELASFYLKNAIELDNEFLNAHRNMATIHISNDDYKNAFKEVSFIISRNPNDSLALLFAGESKSKLKELEEAKIYLKKVITLEDPLEKHRTHKIFASQSLGNIYFTENKLDLAIEYLTLSNFLLDKDNPVDRSIKYHNLSTITFSYYLTKDYKKAKECLDYLLVTINNEKEESIIPDIEVIQDFINENNLIDKIERAIIEENLKNQKDK